MDLLKQLEKETQSLDFPETIEIAVKFLRKQVKHYNWVGIYMLEGEELVLRAWDGPEATEHVRIPIGAGICGLAAREKRTVIVGDVNTDPRYLACFPYTRSEIVVPLFKTGKVIGEIDIDSNTPHAFTEKDRSFLEQIAHFLGTKHR
ncbi:GAF domain-containing protein [Candidatus Acetothermia bacterium]|nr:GAF domain-containing protein [Candidatus Acetothermia bacterium]MBI3459954.1 GAF domain-containing protein [Candidatus Acetothermia bacterium]MBI3660277.1 GAF domain-containing protein [Candidatus Acetothermia bacterium]